MVAHHWMNHPLGVLSKPTNLNLFRQASCPLESRPPRSLQMPVRISDPAVGYWGPTTRSEADVDAAKHPAGHEIRSFDGESQDCSAKQDRPGVDEIHAEVSSILRVTRGHRGLRVEGPTFGACRQQRKPFRSTLAVKSRQNGRLAMKTPGARNKDGRSHDRHYAAGREMALQGSQPSRGGSDITPCRDEESSPHRFSRLQPLAEGIKTRSHHNDRCETTVVDWNLDLALADALQAIFRRAHERCDPRQTIARPVFPHRGLVPRKRTRPDLPSTHPKVNLESPRARDHVPDAPEPLPISEQVRPA